MLTKKSKKYAIASVVFLVLAIVYIKNNIIPCLICFVASLGMGYFTYKQIKDDKKKAELLKQDEEKRIAEQKAKEEQRKEREDILKKGICPEFLKANYDFNNMVIVDTETTGINAEKDEMLQLSITDINGNVLFDHYLKPKHKRTWKDAEEVNGISPDMVKNESHIDAYAEEVSELLYDKTIVGYNVEYDANFLKASGLIGNKNILVDVMIPFAEINGEINTKYGGYKWKKLTDCARYYGYKWSGKAHNSAEDCKATAYCFLKMCGKE